MAVLQLLIFVVMQGILAFCFYRLVLRRLPTEISNLILEVHLRNDFTGISSEVAEMVRSKLLLLEAERFDAVAKYEALKGRRGLTTTENNERASLKRTQEQLDRQIRGCRKRLSDMYSSETLDTLRRFENLRLVAALNKALDKRANSPSG